MFERKIKEKILQGPMIFMEQNMERTWSPQIGILTKIRKNARKKISPEKKSM